MDASMCTKISENGMLENGSEVPENCECGSKDLTTSHDPLGTSDTQLSKETVFEAPTKTLSKSVKELEKDNILPPSQINDDFTDKSGSLPHGKSKVVSFIKDLNLPPLMSLTKLASKSQRILLHVRKVAKKSGTMLNGVHKIISKWITKELGNIKTYASTPSETNNRLIQKRNEEAKEEKRDQQQSIEVLSWEPRAFLFHNFLSKEECEHLIKLSTPHLQRSPIYDGTAGLTKVTRFRTSFGTSLKRGFDEIIRNIEKRIAEVTFIPIEHGENLNVLRYEVGQNVRPHRDYFDIPTINNCNGGQRIGTFLMYLSPVEEGGETIFPWAKGNITSVPWLEPGNSEQNLTGVVVKPKMGDAVFFWSIKPDGTLDPSSIHAGVPVIKGIKWCCTKWMRARKYVV